MKSFVFSLAVRAQRVAAGSLVFERRLRAKVAALLLSRLPPPPVTFSPRVAQSGQNMRGNTRFPLLQGVEPLFQKHFLTRRRLRARIDTWNWAEKMRMESLLLDCCFFPKVFWMSIFVRLDVLMLDFKNTNHKQWLFLCVFYPWLMWSAGVVFW